MNSVKKVIFRFIFVTFSKLPIEWQLFVSDIFFYRLPISFILALPTTDFKGYFRYALPKKNDVIVDCGGYLGNFSVLASRIVGKKGKVLTFEPDGKCCEIMKKRFRRLGIKNIQIYQYALYNKKCQMYLEGEPGAGSLILDKKSPAINRLKVNCIDLDSLVKTEKMLRIDFIKMDVEGAEIEAIDGMKLILKKFRPNLAIATYHIRNGKQTSNKVKRKLIELKYKFVKTDYPTHLTTYGNR